MRRLVTLSSLAAILIIATAAYAGGAVWEFEGYHRPGDVIESVTAVAWEHNATLGTPEEGPYLVYLAHAAADGLPAQAAEAEMSDEFSRFDGLWQVVVAVVALLLVGRMVRAESLWHWRAGVGAKPADGKGSLDVVVDE